MMEKKADAIKIRLLLYFSKSKLDNIDERIKNLMATTELDRLINLANDKDLINLVIAQCEEHLKKKKEKGKENENMNENKENENKENNNGMENRKDGRKRNKVGVDNRGLDVLPETRGLRVSESEEEYENDNNNHHDGRNGNELGYASGNGV